MLTPLDIENRVFKKTMGGYNKDDVEEFMEILLNDYEKMYKDNIEYKDKIETLINALNHYKGQEETMQNAIMAAQRAADSLEATAKEKADLIIKEANFKADEIVRQAKEKAVKLDESYITLKKEIENYKMRVTAIMQSQLDIMKDIDALTTAPSSKFGFGGDNGQQEG